MKILYISNFVKTFSLVFQNEISVLKKLGHDVEWVANFSNFIGDTNEIPLKIHDVPFKSYPFHLSNLKAYNLVKKLLKENKYDAIICSTPIGGTIGRLAGKKAKIPKIIYCAHGFLFRKGINPFVYWIFKSHEKLLAKYTDAIVTINNEDFKAAKSFKLRNNGGVFFVHGAGVDFTKKELTDEEKHLKREELGVSDSAFLLISAGYLNKNKNNKVIIDALSLRKDENTFYIVCGEGPYREKLEKLTTKKGLEKQVIFLGYRNDVNDLMLCCDAFVMPSFREGAPRSLLEAINAGLPCVGSNIRGIKDILQNGNGGVLCNPNSPKDFLQGIEILKNNIEKRNEYIFVSQNNVHVYSSENVKSELFDIYKKIL